MGRVPSAQDGMSSPANSRMRLELSLVHGRGISVDHLALLIHQQAHVNHPSACHHSPRHHLGRFHLALKVPFRLLR